MTFFQKPQALKAALKMALYGPAGSGKTFTALLIAEGLARHCGKRIAFVDTERGTNFYTQPVEQRRVHPAAFDIDILHSRSITEVIAAVRALDLSTRGALIIDSISHLWDAAIAAYTGKKTKAGTVPLHAWGSIKSEPHRRTEDDPRQLRLATREGAFPDRGRGHRGFATSQHRPTVRHR